MDTAIATLPEALVREVEKLSVEQRLALIDALWDGLESCDVAGSEPTPEQACILDQRYADYLANSDAILARHGLSR